MMSPEIAACRAEIDRIDRELLDLLGQRFRVVDRVAAEKCKGGIPAVVPERIEVVIANVQSAAAAAGVPAASAERLWRLIIEETIRYETALGVTGPATPSQM
jgi:isochorismate pyruvate lyase